MTTKEVAVMGKTFNVYGTVEEPLFKAKDVHKMVQSVDEDEKVRNIVPTLGGNHMTGQKMNLKGYSWC